jgi:uncharacterized protein (DUF1501 family)
MNKNFPQSGLSRRDLLKLGLCGAGGLAFLAPGSLLAQPMPKPLGNAKAKSVIQIWMWGGPSHLDTFDPKPDAGYDYCGPFNKAIPTNVDGIQVGEFLPLLAQHADKYSIIRSMTHGQNGHETASYIVQTGRWPDRLVYPCAGAVVSLFKGMDAGYKGAVAPYIVLTKPQGRFSEAGFLGDKFKPFATGGDPNQAVFAVEGIVAQGVTDQRQAARRKLMGELDTLGKAMPQSAILESFDKTEQSAYELMTGDARKVFDLTQEKDEVRDRYGRTTFGQSCLMARRLVEHGVPYITINYNGWDTHKQHFETMRRNLPVLDQGFSTLLADLSERGLLDSTIVWWGGEFGRTPRVDWEAPWNGGRGHFGRCFSSVVAGGGFKGGQIVGASDSTGSEVKDRAVTPQDMIGSVYELLGIDPDGPLPNGRGMDVKVLADSPTGVKGNGRLKEIM